MIIFQKIRFKNILSVGNVFQEFDFLSAKQHLFTGKNGSGKSTIEEALTFVLYGKAFRDIKKDQLINSINKKQLHVEIEFSINGIEYKVVRSIKPNNFEIYINGKLKAVEAAVRDYQSFLEDNILKMSEKTFKQIVILGSTNYIPFMRLKSNERRVVTEDLLDIQVFSVMNALSKENIKSLSESYRELNTDTDLLDLNIKNTESKISLIEDHNKSNETRIRDSLNVEHERLLEYFKELPVNHEFHGDVVSNLENTLEFLDLERTDLSDKKYVIHSKLAEYKKRIEFLYDNDGCPVCDQIIEEEFKCDKVSVLKVKAREKLNDINDIKKKILINADAIVEHKRLISAAREITVKINIISANINTSTEITNKLKKELDEINNIDTTQYKKSLQEISKLYEEKNTVLSDVVSRAKIAKVAAELLKDNGIKSTIIKSYIPTINKLIRKYLDILDFNVDFRFDENFKEEIRSRYRDNFAYANFSEGEKLRIDLTLLFTWREIANMRNSASTNLLILDEIGDSSLDAEGFEAFMTILNHNRNNQNIIVISHNDSLQEKFENVYTFKKIDNFSDVIHE